MITIEIIDRAVGQMSQQLRVLGEALPEKLMDAAESLEPRLLSEVKKDFDVGGRPPGGPWARNHPKTVKKKGFNAPLVDTGRTREKFDLEFERGDEGVEVYISNSMKSPRNSSVGIWDLHRNADKYNVRFPKRVSGTLADEAMPQIADAFMEQFVEQVDAILSTA
jgi:hypothetical protein